MRLKLRCLWEKSQKRVLFDVSEDVVMSFCVAGVALCDIPCVRCKTVVRLKLPCLWEKLQKRVLFDVSEAVLMSFCVAGVALCCIPLV